MVTKKLVTVAESVIGRGERCADTWGRPYFLVKGIDHPREIRDIANSIAGILGLSVADEPSSDEEMRDIYDEFSVSEHDEDAYLSDGICITPRGRLKERP